MNLPRARFFEIIYIFQVWFSFIFLLLFREVFNIFDCCSVFWLSFYFCFSWFLSTFMHIIDTCWFTIIFGCVFLKRLVILSLTPPTIIFSRTREYGQLTNHTNHTKRFLQTVSSSSFLFLQIYPYHLQNSSSVFFIKFFSYPLNLCLLVL